MHKKEIGKYLKYRTFQNKKIHHFIVIPVMMIAIYLLVYFTDDKVYAHAMYIPIIYASFALDLKFSTLVGFIGGIALGPLIPFSVETGEAQRAIHWIFRLFSFTSIGFFSGYLISKIQDDSVKIIDLFSLDQDTKLINLYGYKLIKAEQNNTAPKTIIAFHIYNYEVLLDIFGLFIYTKILIKVANLLKPLFENSVIIKPNDNKLWIVADKTDTDIVASKIYQILHNNLVIEDVSFYIEYYIGINHTNSPKDFIDNRAFLNADIAARYAFKNQVIFKEFDASKINTKQEFTIIGSFEHALNSNELYLDYQPIIDLKNNKINMFESLIRWKHPRMGQVSPDLFIPFLEQTNLINVLSIWVLNKVISKIEEFNKAGIGMKFSVNISTKNLSEPTFVRRMIDLKNKGKIKDDQIELEITESIQLVDNCDKLRELRANGFSIAIDDFGTGYSTLSNLYDFPASKIKIDRFFTKQMEETSNTIQIMDGIVSFAHKLGFKTTFEGIENLQMDSKIRIIKADFGQGYYYSKPINELDVLDFYKKNRGFIDIPKTQD